LPKKSFVQRIVSMLAAEIIGGDDLFE